MRISTAPPCSIVTAMRSSATAVADHLGALRQHGGDVGRRHASIGAEKAIADDADDHGDAEQGGEARDQHQPAHPGDDLLLLGIERLLVVRLGAMIGHRHGRRRHPQPARKPVDRRPPSKPAIGSTARSPPRTALSRTRLKALILDGEVTIGGRTIRDPGHRVNSGDTDRGRGAGARAGRARRREHPARHRLRGRRPHRHRQAGRPGGASGRRATPPARWSMR